MQWSNWPQSRTEVKKPTTKLAVEVFVERFSYSLPSPSYESERRESFAKSELTKRRRNQTKPYRISSNMTFFNKPDGSRFCPWIFIFCISDFVWALLTIITVVKARCNEPRYNKFLNIAKKINTPCIESPKLLHYEEKPPDKTKFWKVSWRQVFTSMQRN